jgi:hypothetical protein
MLRRTCIAIASLYLVGCGSSGNTPRQPSGMGGSSSGSGGIRVNFDGGPTGGGGTTASGSGGATGTGNTAGAMATGTLVFQGGLPVLLPSGLPCTFEEGATADRWCGFIADSVSSPGNTDLFVVNVTKAAGGVSISCGLADANCLKLTSSFFQENVAPVLHPALFQGDTLAYFDVTGTPFAWRPGMTAGRMLAVADPATKNVVLCIPDIKGTAITCQRDLPAAMQTDAQVFLSDLLAGRVDSAANPPLARLETAIVESSADVMVSHFQVGFPVPGGNTVAWSARAVKGGPEVLKAQTMGDDASRVTVATNVNSWRVSPDGARWYWRSQVSETTRAGALQSAPFPGGAGPTVLAANTLEFAFPTATSLVSLDTAKQLLGFADPAGAPTTSQVLDTGVTRLVNLSAQGSIAYTKTALTSATQFVNLHVKKSDGTGACTVSAATDAYLSAVGFTRSSTGVAWIQSTPTAFPARFTRLSDCTRMDVAADAVWTEPVGDRGLIYLDSLSDTTGTVAMWFRPLATDGAVSADPATLVSGGVGTFTVVPTAGLDALLYTVDSGGNEDGVYVKSFGP